MPVYEFTATVYISALNEDEAKFRAEEAEVNIKEMTGHSPFYCELEIDPGTCEKSDYDPEDDLYEDEAEEDE